MWISQELMSPAFISNATEKTNQKWLYIVQLMQKRQRFINLKFESIVQTLKVLVCIKTLQFLLWNKNISLEKSRELFKC